MSRKGFIVPPGGGSVLNMAPGRSAALKLVGGETADSIMLFEEIAALRHRDDVSPAPRQRRGRVGAERRDHLPPYKGLGRTPSLALFLAAVRSGHPVRRL